MSVSVSKSIFPLDWEKDSPKAFLEWKRYISDELKRMYFEENDSIKPQRSKEEIQEQIDDARGKFLTLQLAKKILRNGNFN